MSALQKKIGLIGQLHYMLDEGGQLTYKKVSELPDSAFSLYDAISLNHANTPYWFRFSLQNNSSETRRLILDLNDILINSAVLCFEKDGKVIKERIGLDYPLANKKVSTRTYGYQVEIKPNSIATYHLQVTSSVFLVFSPILFDPLESASTLENFVLVSALEIGLLSGLLLYILIVMIHGHEYDKTLFAYSMFLAASILILLYMNGYLLVVFNDISWLNKWGYTFAVSALGIAFLLIAKVQMHDEEKYRVARAIIQAAINILFFLLFVSLFIPPEISILAAQTIGSALILLLSMFSIYLLLFDKGSNNWFAFGNLLFLLAAAFSNVSSAGMVDTAWGARHGYEIGLCLLSVFLALGISDKINRYRQERTDFEVSAMAANASNEAKSDFLAKMSHEIRTPMSGVLGFVELLAATPLDNEQVRYVNLIRSSGQSLLNLINDILDYSRVEAGKLQVESIPFNLMSLLDDVFQVYSAQAQHKGLRFAVEIDQALPVTVKGDPTRLRQILNNLLSNAIKFTERGGIFVWVQGNQQGGDVCNLHVSVRDTGIGIRPALQEQLFTSFTQADSSTTRKYGGSGLGLSICKQLVELMGGKIHVESDEGSGSLFWFVVPLVQDSELPAHAPAMPDPVMLPEQIPGDATSVLVVEDNEINRQVLGGLLEKQGFPPHFVVNGRQALDCLQKHPGAYRLVFMDCEMPIMDGFEATRQIRRHEARYPGNGKIWIVAYTAHASADFLQRCLDAGMDELLSKPIDQKKLIGILSRYLERES